MQIDGLVSTIIPVHDRARMAAQAVHSVLSQDYRPIEIILVDDGSSEEERRGLEALAAAHSEVLLLTQQNAGPGAAREAGRVSAQGDYIQYLDSDDLLLPGKFSSQVRALEEHPDCDVAYGMTHFRHADGTPAQGAWKGTGRRVEKMFPSFLVSRWWDTPNPLYCRSVCDRAGPWMPIWMEEDWEYDCRIASLGAKLAYVDDFVCEVRDHTGSRLSRQSFVSERLADRALAHIRILGHALDAQIGLDTPEMQHFARALFLLARQCGAAGLDKQASLLFACARRASGQKRAKGWDFRLVSTAVEIWGWTPVGKAAAVIDRLRF